MNKSIMQTEKVCFITGTTRNLDLHHCIHGSNRKKADKHGLTVYLNHDVHMRLHAHQKPFEGLDAKLKKVAQEAYMKHYGATVEDFIREYGRNYL